jgi:hypothetical protein
LPKLREITTIINQSLQAGNFHGRKFQSGNWLNIAYILSRVENEIETKFPAIVDNNGEGTSVAYDDTYPIQFYHRIIAPLQYPDMKNDGFGNPSAFHREIAEMQLICIGDRSKFDAYTEEVCAAITADLTRELKPTQLATLHLQDCTIEIIDTNTDTEAVFNQEFQNVDKNLAPENFMIAVKYRITTEYGKNCFTLCN